MQRRFGSTISTTKLGGGSHSPEQSAKELTKVQRRTKIRASKVVVREELPTKRALKMVVLIVEEIIMSGNAHNPLATLRGKAKTHG